MYNFFPIISICYYSLTPPIIGTSLADSPGIAILVNCTYKSTKAPLSGTAKDAEKMLTTFKNLNYVVHQLEDPTKSEMQAKMNEVTKSLKKCKFSKEEAEEKVIIFCFSGHGTTEENIEKLYADDMETLQLKDEIIYPLTEPSSVQYVPKLFLIDACRGGDEIPGTAGGAGAALEKIAPSDDKLSSKGFVRKLPRHLVGNYYIAYATVPDHVSWSGREGSLWMPKLAEAMWRETDEAFQVINAKVMRQVSEELGKAQQQCSSDDRLNVGPLYLQKKLDT